MKNLIIIFILFFLSNCGYSSIYKNQSQNFQINIIEMKGDNEFNNLIKNEINLYSNNNSKKKYEINIFSEFKKITISKDSAGTATNFKLSVKTKIIVNINDKNEIMEFNEDINIRNNLDSFEQNNYEKNIKKNFASSIREKLIIKMLSINDI
jgi:hypothetical protein